MTKFHVFFFGPPFACSKKTVSHAIDYHLDLEGPATPGIFLKSLFSSAQTLLTEIGAYHTLESCGRFPFNQNSKQ